MEDPGQGYIEKRTHPDIHDVEKITDPRVLAEIVLNTLDLTFDYSLLKLDKNKLAQLMKDPAKNWADVLSMVSTAAANAALLQPQIESLDKAVRILEDHPAEGLPVTMAGDPAKKIVDRRGLNKLLEEISEKELQKRTVEDDQQKDWSDEQRNEDNSQRDASMKEGVMRDPVRRVAYVISNLQGDTIVQRLSLVRGYGEVLEPTLRTGYTPKLERHVERVITGMTDAERFAQYNRIALKEFSKGNIPNEAKVKAIVDQGSPGFVAYLETFAPPASPSPTQAPKA